MTDELHRLRSDNRELSRLLAEALARETLALFSPSVPPRSPAMGPAAADELDVRLARALQSVDVRSALREHRVNLVDHDELEALLWFHAEALRLLGEGDFGSRSLRVVFESERYKPLARVGAKATP